MDFLIQPMITALSALQNVLGSYGLAIIAFTVIIRLILWPLNTKQAKSMKAMQELQPKMKEIQEKHKDNPQAMQQEIMKLYSNNKFNPLAGCLPMLVQIPIFIGLYSALSSPDFMALAGQEQFAFVRHLHNTWRSTGGTPFDNTLAVTSKHKVFDAGKEIRVYFDGTENVEVLPIKNLRMDDSKKLLNIQPKPPIPGRPMTITISQSDLGFDDAYMSNVVKLEASIINMATKEIENLELQPSLENKGRFATTLPTEKSSTNYHFDVLGLIVVYGLLSWAYQQSMTLMSGNKSTTMAGPQAMMTKFMPLLFAVLMLVIQIPAGVLLYLNTTMVMMLVQNIYLYYKDKKNPPSPGAPSNEVLDVK